MSVSRLVEKGFALVMGATAGQHSACPRPDTAGHGRTRPDKAEYGRSWPDTAGHGHTDRIQSRDVHRSKSRQLFFSEDYKKK